MSSPQAAFPDGPFPSTAVAKALNMKQSTIGTWADRGIFDCFDHSGGGRGKVRMLTLRDALATALLWQKAAAGVEAVEFSPFIAHQYADRWLRTRHQAKRVQELVIRYYGVPGTDVSKVSVLMNEDALDRAPDAGARVTLRFDLDAIFEPLIAALAEAA